MDLAIQTLNGTVPGTRVKLLGFQHTNVRAAAERAGLEQWRARQTIAANDAAFIPGLNSIGYRLLLLQLR